MLGGPWPAHLGTVFRNVYVLHLVMHLDQLPFDPGALSSSRPGSSCMKAQCRCPDKSAAHLGVSASKPISKLTSTLQGPKGPKPKSKSQTWFQRSNHESEFKLGRPHNNQNYGLWTPKTKPSIQIEDCFSQSNIQRSNYESKLQTMNQNCHVASKTKIETSNYDSQMQHDLKVRRGFPKLLLRIQKCKLWLPNTSFLSNLDLWIQKCKLWLQNATLLSKSKFTIQTTLLKLSEWQTWTQKAHLPILGKPCKTGRFKIQCSVAKPVASNYLRPNWQSKRMSA